MNRSWGEDVQSAMKDSRAEKRFVVCVVTVFIGEIDAGDCGEFDVKDVKDEDGGGVTESL